MSPPEILAQLQGLTQLHGPRTDRSRPRETAAASRREPGQFPAECLTPGRATAAGRPRRPPLDDDRFGRAIGLQRQGLLDAAYEIFVELLCESTDPVNSMSFEYYLAQNRVAAGDLEAALRFGLAAMAIQEAVMATQKLPTAAQLQGKIGWWAALAAGYAALGDEPNARERLSQAETTLVQMQETGGQVGPMTYLLLAVAYMRLHEMEGARKAIRIWEEQATTIAVSALPTALEGSGGFNLVAALTAGYLDHGAPAEAKRVLSRLLQSVPDRPEHDLRPEPDLRLPILESLARVSLEERDGRAALSYLARLDAAMAQDQRRNAQLRRSLEDVSRRPEARSLWGLAAISALLRGVTAVDYTQRARVEWLYGRAHLLLDQPAEARRRLLAAVEVIENLRGFLRPEDRLSFFAQHAGPYYGLVESLLSAPGEDGPPATQKGRSRDEVAFYYAEAARARALSEKLAGAQAGRVEGLPANLAQRERELLQRAQAELRSGIPFDQSRAHGEFTAFVEGLRQTHEAYATFKYPVPVWPSQVPLRDDEVLLAYAVLERHLAVWLLRPGSPVLVTLVPVPRDRVLESVRALRESLEPDGAGRLPAFNTAASAALHGWLLAPLRGTPPGSRILVIPDSALGTIPFEVLLERGGEGAGEFAGARYTFSYAPAATVLAHQRRRDRSPSATIPLPRLLALGDPEYEGAAGSGSPPGGTGERAAVVARAVAVRDYARTRGTAMFSRLPATDREVREAAAALQPLGIAADIRVGRDANEADLKRADLAGYQYLHFATHGVLAEDLPYLRQPALVLSQAEPLKGEDGFLTMQEVANLKLAADLTVLSACQTALGRELSGEGTIGLARAFLYAGSRGVIVSLWRVADESTAMLMSRFYGHVGRGVSPAEALSRAKRDLQAMSEYAHPFHWAPFIVYGSN